MTQTLDMTSSVPTLWGEPAAALEAMRAGCWDRDAELAALQSALALEEAGGRAAVRTGHTAPDLAVEALRNTLRLDDRPVRVVMAMASPRIVLVDGLLDVDDCEALMRLAQPRLARSTTLGDPRDDDRGDTLRDISEARTSRDTFLARDEGGGVVARIDERLHDLFGWPRSAGETLQVVRYGPGEEFGAHHDFFAPGTHEAREGRQRVGTVICYLNDPEAGGHTAFPDLGLRIAPRRGAALFFGYEQPSARTRTLHAGLPVLEGTKWIATKWFTQV
jgi:prolyl 4-hydroxylase